MDLERKAYIQKLFDEQNNIGRRKITSEKPVIVNCIKNGTDKNGKKYYSVKIFIKNDSFRTMSVSNFKRANIGYSSKEKRIYFEGSNVSGLKIEEASSGYHFFQFVNTAFIKEQFNGEPGRIEMDWEYESSVGVYYLQF